MIQSLGANTLIQKMTDEEIQDLVRQFVDDRPQDWSLLMDENDKIVCRVPLESGHSVILKLWSQSGLLSTIRHFAGIGPIEREVNTLRHLENSTVRVPRLYGHCWLRGFPYSQATVIEDLGECQRALETYKEIRDQGDLGLLDTFEQELIDITENMLNENVVDPDHGVVNMLVTPAGELTRIDFEVARITKNARRPGKLLGLMIGRLMMTMTYATQPDMERLANFGRRLQDQLQLSPFVLRAAREFVQDCLEHQLATTGIDTRWPLDW